MIEVHVQIWGPFESSGAGYNWITIGVITDPKDFDLNVLRKQVKDVIKKREYQPNNPMARLLFKKEGTTYMKTTFENIND